VTLRRPHRPRPERLTARMPCAGRWRRSARWSPSRTGPRGPTVSSSS